MTKDILTQRDVLNKYEATIVELFQDFFRENKVQLYLFGSRAKGTANKASDIDIAVKCEKEISVQLSKIRETLHESHIPYKVEVVDFHKAGKALKQSINSEGILIWEN